MLPATNPSTALMARVREYVEQHTELAAGAAMELLPKIILEAAISDDYEFRFKVYKELRLAAMALEPKQPTGPTLGLSFQIILDDTPQVAPPRRARARVDELEIEDAVEIQVLAASLVVIPVELGPTLDALAASLVMAEDE